MNEPEVQKELYDLISRKESRSMWQSAFLVLLILLLGLTTVYYGKQAQKNATKFEVLSDTLRIQRDELAKTKADLDSSRIQIEAARDSLKAMLLKAQSTLEKYNTTESRVLQDEINKEIVATDKKGYIIYIHAYGREGQTAARSIYDRLRKSGYPPKGIEIMKAPFNSRVTYFHKDDMRVANAIGKWVMDVCREVKPDFDVSKLTPALSSLKAPTKQIEIWINFDPLVIRKDFIGKEVIDKGKQYK